MEINLSAETIKTVYNSLKGNRHRLKWDLQVSIASGKVNPNKKAIIEHQLEEVEDALAVFEELMDRI